MSSTKLRTLNLGDFHSGSNVSLMHPKAFNSEGGRAVSMNRWQEVLWEQWKEVAKKHYQPDVCIINGDACELMVPRNRMTETWTSSPIDQVINVVRLIEMIQPKKVYIQRGTPYHVTEGGLHVEEMLGLILDKGYKFKEDDFRDDIEEQSKKEKQVLKQVKRLYGKIEPVADVVNYRNRYSYEYRIIDLAPKAAETRALYHFTHHIGSSSTWAYYGTGPSKAMATLMLNESHFIDRKVWGRITGLVRSHVHHYWYEESANRRMLVVPAWQLQTPFMFKVMPESVPDIGAVEFIHHSDGHFEQIKTLMDAKDNRPPIFVGHKGMIT
jgi:hypothetical protein